MMEVTRPFELRLRLRFRWVVEVCNGLRACCTWLKILSLINKMIGFLIVWLILVFIFDIPIFWFTSIHDLCIWVLLTWFSTQKFFHYSHMTSKLNILSYYAEHSKELVLYYVLPLFIILKSSNKTGQPACLEKMTLVWEKLIIYFKIIVKHFKICILQLSSI